MDKTKVPDIRHNVKNKKSNIERVGGSVVGMWEKANLKILLVIIFIILTSSTIFSLSSANKIIEGQKLAQGKNNVTINQTLSAHELIALNPDIESIHYFDKFLNKGFGYVNIFGGVGKNFLIVPENTYEITSKQDTTLILPYKEHIVAEA